MFTILKTVILVRSARNVLFLNYAFLDYIVRLCRHRLDKQKTSLQNFTTRRAEMFEYLP